jgi:FAD/FMN-containing dehydrogenase
VPKAPQRERQAGAASLLGVTTAPVRPLPAARPPLLDLAGRLRGRLLLPGGDAYATRTAALTLPPLAVVEAETADDVVAAVRFAGRHGLDLAVQATGLGATPCSESTLLVRTAGLAECTVHEEGWARVGAGVRWQRVLDEAGKQGLAALAGSSPAAGVVGQTLGGGLGPVARTYGLASDQVRALEVVTGDGVLRRVTPTEHPDLFWGLRGGRGALGVVTAVEFDLLAVDELYAGALEFAGADAATVLRRWASWCAGLPRQATTSIALLRSAGERVVAVRFAWVGDADAGAAVLAPLRECAVPLHDGVRVRPYADMGRIHRFRVPSGPVSEAQLLLDALPAEAIELLLAVAGPAAASPQVLVELRQLGGAIARFPERASAFSHRDGAFSLVAVGPAEDGAAEHAAGLVAVLAPWSSDRGLATFGRDESPAALARVYDPATLQRLAALAAHYDPHRILAGARGLHG